MKKIFTFISACVVCMSANAQLWTVGENLGSDKWAWTGTASSANIQYELSVPVQSGKPQVKFTLSIGRINTSEAAAFTQALVEDANYWAPYFYRRSAEMTSGEGFIVQNNVGTLVVDNVDMVTSQFYDYEELESVTLKSSGDYTIPNGCFSGLNSRWETLDCQIGGTLTIEPNAFPVNDETRNLIIDTTNESVAQTLNAYKATNNMSYKVKLNGEFYDQTTAIGNVAAPAGADKWATYNVGGQQVDAAYKGIVIVGGKKMVK